MLNDLKRKRIVLSCFLTSMFVIGIGNIAHAKIITASTTKQLVKAIQTSQRGDVIELKDGVYPINTKNGLVIKNKHNLTIRSQSGKRDKVILQGKGINNDGVHFIFKLNRSPYFTLQDLTMKDTFWHHIQINNGSSHFKLINLVMVDAGEAPVKVTSPGNKGPYSDYGLIENCWIGFTKYGTRAVVEGIDIIASAGTVIRNSKFYRIKLKGDPANVGWGVFAKCNAEDTVIENNYFEDCDIAISFGNGGCPKKYARHGDGTYQHRRGIVRNNVVNRSRDNAIHMNSAKDFKIYNNTLWSTFKEGRSSIDIRFNSNGKIYNNICSEIYRLRDGGTGTFDANIWFADPSFFVNQPNGDFHLASGATKAIDKGVDTSADVLYDIDQQKRPMGLAIDIGADEFYKK